MISRLIPAIGPGQFSQIDRVRIGSTEIGSPKCYFLQSVTPRTTWRPMLDRITDGRTYLVFDYAWAGHPSNSKDADGTSLLQQGDKASGFCMKW